MPRTENSLGHQVRALREQQGLSVRSLAKLAEVDPTWLSRIEHDQYQKPDARLLSRLADTLDIEAATLYRAAGYGKPPTLPTFPGYLRARYDLPDEAIAQLQAHFDLINERYPPERRYP